jgi:tetrahydromethanopterin S-methyltransferase subunit A
MISEKQIKFLSNLQDEAAEKYQIQSIQVEEIIQITEWHRYLLKSI